MKPTLHVILGDQLSLSLATLENCNKQKDIILMCEVMEECTYVKHHKKKIAFLFSAMRHFAEELKQKGYKVDYVKIDDPKNTHSFTGEVGRALNNHGLHHIVVTHPGEFRVLEAITSWEKQFPTTLEIKADTRFLCSLDEFGQWASQRKELRLEHFYRLMRQKHHILMEGPNPVGGAWNYDKENRKSPKPGLTVPPPFHCSPDAITQEVLTTVETLFSEHFGDLKPFYFAVTREQALGALDNFIKTRLKHFGDYQDGMVEGEPWMFHSHLSFYLNCGLLLPRECLVAAQNAYEKNQAPLNATEGFVRQILGWREYVRGVYWLKMPSYKKRNALKANRPLPPFFWTAQTNMNCIKQCVKQTQEFAYAHHIQRLMVLGNFALLAGLDPQAVNEWYLLVYADAYEWVELPNVMGMVLFADGGLVASKPYAAGGSYIQKMSNYCGNCKYDVTIKSGKGACPFHFLYWDFLSRHREILEKNHRTRMMYKTYDSFTSEKKESIFRDSMEFFNRLDNKEQV